MQGEQFEKAYSYDVRPRREDTEISRQQVTSEKIPVNKRDLTCMEETEKPRYPKDIDVGRIVIEEIPEEKEYVTKLDISKRDEVKSRYKELETGHQKVYRQQIREDEVHVGRLDTTGYGETPKDSKQVEDTLTHIDTLGKDPKVSMIKTSILIIIKLA